MYVSAEFPTFPTQRFSGNREEQRGTERNVEITNLRSGRVGLVTSQKTRGRLAAEIKIFQEMTAVVWWWVTGSVTVINHQE